MPPDVKAKHDEVKAQIAALDKQKPRPLPTALAIGERGRVPQPTYLPASRQPGLAGIADDAGRPLGREREPSGRSRSRRPTRSRAIAGAGSPSG